MVYLGIDVGSSGIKTCLMDSSGVVLESATRNIEHLMSRPNPSWAERDPIALWESAKNTLNRLARLAEVKAVCIDATSGSIVPIDKSRNPLGAILLYSDKRAEAEARLLLENSPLAREYQRYLPVDPYLVIPKIMWLRQNLPDFSNVSKILNESDFLQMKLTDEICTSPNVAGKAHIDIRSGGYLTGVYEDVGVDLGLLPIVKPIGDVVGEVTKEASQETGLPEGALVVNGVTDSTASDVATGTFGPGQVNATIGVSLSVHAVVREPVPDERRRIYYKTYLGGGFLAGGATDAGTLPLMSMSRLLSKTVQELDDEAEKAPSGADGLIAQPQWVGSRIPYHNPSVRGFLVGMTEANCTAGHIFRSLLEGNAFILSKVVDIIEDLTGEKTSEIRTSGGGSKSNVQNQIISDVTGRRVMAIESSDAAIGSAILAGWAGGRGASVGELAKTTVAVRRIFDPRPDLSRTYLRIRERLDAITSEIYGA
jgi:xylulokinase